MGIEFTSSTNRIYIYTYFVYNMSMNVKNDLPPIDKLRQIMNAGRDPLTSDLAKFNIPRTYLSIMEQNGKSTGLQGRISVCLRVY